MVHGEKFDVKERVHLAFGRIHLGLHELTDRRVFFTKSVLMELFTMWLFVFIGVGAAEFSGMNLISLGLSPARIVLISFAFGFAIFVLVSSSAAVSGGHINPAVTTAMMLTGNIPVVRGVAYVFAQMIGAVIGAYIIKDATPPIQRGVLGSTMVSPLCSGKPAAFGLEFLGTFNLVWTVFATAVDPRGPSQIAPFCIGMSVFISHLALIPLTGSSINPARTFGSAAASGIWTDQALYWFAPICGGLVAAALYCFVFLPTPEEVEKMRAAVQAGADKMEGFGGEGVDAGKLADEVGVKSLSDLVHHPHDFKPTTLTEDVLAAEANLTPPPLTSLPVTNENLTQPDVVVAEQAAREAHAETAPAATTA